MAHDFAKQSVVCYTCWCVIPAGAADGGSGVRRFCAPLPPPVFGERRQVYKPPSLVPRVETYIEMRYVSANLRREEHHPRHPKSKEAGKHPWGLPALTTAKRTRAGRSRLALKAPCTLTLTAPAGFAMPLTEQNYSSFDKKSTIFSLIVLYS